jgi:hypothetical protein
LLPWFYPHYHQVDLKALAMLILKSSDSPHETPSSHLTAALIIVSATQAERPAS